jgi:hypothetical protein
MNDFIHISAAGNTMAPCCLVLEELGYVVSNKMVDDSEHWIAEKISQRFVATDPCTLLGLVKLVEIRGEDWRASDEEIADFLERIYGRGEN